MNSVSNTQTAAQADTSASNAAIIGTKQVQPAIGKTTDDKSTGKATTADVKSAVDDLNSTLSSLNVQREFYVDDSTKDVVVKVIDKSSQQVIKQIPSEEALKLSKNIREMVGLLYDSTS